MKFSVGFLSLLLRFALATNGTPGCNADNCARAVTGTRSGKMPDVSSRMADCSSFMLATVTPEPTTVVTTVTITVEKRGLEARQATVHPSVVPVYASACSGTARYSSACSCWGITATTTTAPTPTIYSTVTATVTAGCEGKTCGSYVLHNCPQGYGNVCTCGFDTEGHSFCFADFLCSSATTCSSSTDCQTGYKCLTQSCCGDNRCAFDAVGECVNSNTPRAIFGKPRGQAAKRLCDTAAVQC